MAGGPQGLDSAKGTAAALWMRRARLRHFRPSVADLAAYVVGGAIVATMFVSAALSAANAAEPSDPAVSGRVAAVVAGVGVLTALLAAVASGARGGPLAIAGPTVLLVMLAPVDRGAVLRLPAARQIVLAASVGALVGAVSWIATAGDVVSPRASPEWWIFAGAVTGTGCAGAALLGAGLRISSPLSTVMSAVVVVWWSVDALLETATSPMAALARMPFHAPSAAGIAYALSVAVAAAVLGIDRIGGLSLEKAWRRSGAADQLRVAVGLNDLRTAVLVLRRRASESPRGRPWWRVGGRWTRRSPIAARSVRALLRWPLSRVRRFLILAAAVAAVTVAADQFLALGLVAAVLVFLGALDAVDALAQELDHPDLQRGYPISEESLAARHIAVPLAMMTGFCVVASCMAGLMAGPSVAVVGIAVSPIIALAAVSGAALTATRTARPFTKMTDIGLPPEVVAPRIIARVVAPVVPLVATLVPLIAGHSSSWRVAAMATLPGGALSLVVLVLLLHRRRLERFVAAVSHRRTRLATGLDRRSRGGP